MSATPEIELIWLQKRADLCGCYVNRHPVADVTRGGDLYLQSRRTQKNFGDVPSIVKFATVEEVEAALTIIEQERFAKAEREVQPAHGPRGGRATRG
jgi:hypothetical protein